VVLLKDNTRLFQLPINTKGFGKKSVFDLIVKIFNGKYKFRRKI